MGVLLSARRTLFKKKDVAAHHLVLTTLACAAAESTDFDSEAYKLMQGARNLLVDMKRRLQLELTAPSYNAMLLPMARMMDAGPKVQDCFQEVVGWMEEDQVEKDTETHNAILIAVAKRAQHDRSPNSLSLMMSEYRALVERQRLPGVEACDEVVRTLLLAFGLGPTMLRDLRQVVRDMKANGVEVDLPREALFRACKRIPNLDAVKDDVRGLAAELYNEEGDEDTHVDDRSDENAGESDRGDVERADVEAEVEGRADVDESRIERTDVSVEERAEDKRADNNEP